MIISAPGAALAAPGAFHSPGTILTLAGLYEEAALTLCKNVKKD